MLITMLNNLVDDGWTMMRNNENKYMQITLWLLSMVTGWYKWWVTMVDSYGQQR